MSFNWECVKNTKLLNSILVLLLALFAFVGCNSYPAVKSREGRQLIKRLYVACNSKSEAKLSGVAEDLSKFSEAGAISAGEKQAFDSIITLAKQGDWEAAEKSALQLAEGQVGYEMPAEKSP